MRVIAGILAGRRLATETGMRMRPTSDRTREALFSMLTPRLAGARVLDLFSGSGALGIEALSRGAAEVVFVDNHAAAVAVIADNLRHCGCLEKSVLRRASAVDPALYAGLLREGRVPFDLVLMDPPYGLELEGQALARLGMPGLLTRDALVVVEREADAGEMAAAGWERTRVRKHGRARLEFWRIQDEGGE